jgi:PAS domain S-box-containing protein
MKWKWKSLFYFRRLSVILIPLFGPFYIFFFHRVVTLSLSPFVIVHINSAFTQMTGLSSADVLGKAFREIFQHHDSKMKGARSSSLANLHEQSVSILNSKKDKKSQLGYTMKVAVVGPEVGKKMDRKSMTHFMVSIQQKKQESTEAAAAMDMPPPVPVDPIRVAAGGSNHRDPVASDHDTLLSASMRFHCGVMG